MIRSTKSRTQGLKGFVSQKPSGSLLSRGSSAFAKRRRNELDAEVEAAAARFDAMMETVFLIAASDGHVSGEETTHLVELIDELTEGQLPGEAIHAMLEGFVAALERDGFEERADSIADVLDGDQRRAAFTLAAGLAVADGELDADEEQVFATLAESFDIADSEAEDIIQEVYEELARY